MSLQLWPLGSEEEGSEDNIQVGLESLRRRVELGIPAHTHHKAGNVALHIKSSSKGIISQKLYSLSSLPNLDYFRNPSDFVSQSQLALHQPRSGTGHSQMNGHALL